LGVIGYLPFQLKMLGCIVLVVNVFQIISHLLSSCKREQIIDHLGINNAKDPKII